MKNKIPAESGFTLVEIMIMVIIVLLAALTTPNFEPRHRTSQQSACINNLRLIESAKRQWALEHRKQSTNTPQATDLQPYLGGRLDDMPTCPVDSAATFITSYDPRSVGDKPVCLNAPTTHVLPRNELLYDIAHSDLTEAVIRWLVILGIAFGVILCRRHLQKKNPVST